MTYPLPYQILFSLKENIWLSGPMLANKLGVPYSTLDKHIKFLQSDGIPIEHDYRGYRLNDSLKLLDKNVIECGIDTKWRKEALHLIILPTIDSTNTYVKKLVKKDAWTLCLSEQQTEGRGRLGRKWSSPFGENMYLSIARRTNISLAKLSGLSVVVSLALKESLSPWIKNLQSKWPNDLLWQGKKLAGCLVEVGEKNHQGIILVIGIGLNINTQTNLTPLSNHQHCSMRDILNHQLNRNEVIIAVINNILQTFTQFEHHGLNSFLKSWKESDYLYNQHVFVYQSKKTLKGIAKGINELGYLLLEKEDGSYEKISSGEASLNKNF